MSQSVIQPEQDGPGSTGAIGAASLPVDRARLAIPESVERAALVAFWLYWAAWMALLGFIWTRDPDLNHGDSFSDANVLNAERNFDQVGMGVHYGLPAHMATHSAERLAPPYTHYPPGPEWVHQGLKAVGLHELWQFRAASLVAAGLVLLLVMHVFTGLSGSRLIGALGAFFYSWSAPFSQFADSLHQHTYMQLTLLTFLASWLAFERASSPARRRLWLAAATLVFFADIWLTFEHILFVPIFAGLRMLCVGRRRDLAGATTIVLLPLLALALRLGLNSLALGGVQAGFRDLFVAAQYRGAYDDQAAMGPRLLQTWRTRLGRSGSFADPSDAYFVYPLLRPAVRSTAALLAVVLLCTWPAVGLGCARRGFGNALLLLAAGAPWLGVMANHALIHRHVVMLLLPGLSLLLGSLAVCGLLQWWHAPRRAPLRWAGPLAALVLLAGFAVEMRSSLALNHVLALDKRARKEIQMRRSAGETLRRAARGPLQEAERVFIAGGMYPELACQIGRPYEFVLAQSPPPLAPHQALWIEYWGEAERGLARRAWEQYGFPDMLSAPAPASMVFWSDAIPPQRVDVRYEGGCRLVQIRCVPTLDGGSWLVQSRFEVPADAMAHLDDLIQSVHVLDGEGQVVANGDVRLSWGMQDGPEVFVWRTIAQSDLPAGARVRIGLWNAVQDRALKPDVDAGTLPPNAAWDVERSAFVWDAFRTPGASAGSGKAPGALAAARCNEYKRVGPGAD